MEAESQEACHQHDRVLACGMRQIDPDRPGAEPRQAPPHAEEGGPQHQRAIHARGPQHLQHWPRQQLLAARAGRRLRRGRGDRSPRQLTFRGDAVGGALAQRPGAHPAHEGKAGQSDDKRASHDWLDAGTGGRMWSRGEECL